MASTQFMSTKDMPIHGLKRQMDRHTDNQRDTIIPRGRGIITVNVLQFPTPKLQIKWHINAVQTQIMKEQSDHGLYYLSFHCVF